MDTAKTVNCVEWFYGYGGNHIGLHRAIPGLRLIAVCEREAFVVANLVSKMEAGLMDAVPIWTDCKDFPCEPFAGGKVDLFVGSYPCQPFSVAGQRKGTDDERHLWPYCRKFIQGARPSAVFLENVEGHVTMGLSTVLSDLEEDGYVTAWGIFSAAEVGAPHQRKRVFVLAVREGSELLRAGDSWAERAGLTGGSVNVADGGEPGLQGHAGDVNGEGRESGGEGGPASPCGLSGGLPGLHETPDGSNTEGERITAGNQSGILGKDGGERKELAHDKSDGRRAWWPESAGQFRSAGVSEHGDSWPSRPGEPQYGFEPPRVVGNAAQRGECRQPRRTMEAGREADAERQADNDDIDRPSTDSGQEKHGEIKSALGRNFDEHPFGLDVSRLSGLRDSELAEIYSWMEKGTNRTDELRMCGNGVVPATAEKAWRTLSAEIIGGL